MTIIKQGNGVLTRRRVTFIGFASSSYKKVEKDGFVLRGMSYNSLGAEIDILNKYLKRC